MTPPVGERLPSAVQAPGQSLGEALTLDPDVELANTPVVLQERRRLSLSFLGLPLFLGGVLVVLYLWVQSKELDSIEARAITADFIWESFTRHLYLTAVSTVIVILLAVPLGVLLTRPFARPITPVVVGVANIGQGIPSIGVIVLLALWWEIGIRPAIIALVAYSLLPVLRNTMVGLQQVDQSYIEAGRGMGMTRLAVLWKIELPLAVPVILAGVRTALVINVGTATLATFTNAGGLGDIINRGITNSRETITITGGVITGVLALFIDWLAGVVESVLRPKGL